MKTLSNLGEEFFLNYVSRMMSVAPWDILLALADERIKFEFFKDGFRLLAKPCVTEREILFMKNWVEDYAMNHPLDNEELIVDSLFIH